MIFAYIQDVEWTLQIFFSLIHQIKFFMCHLCPRLCSRQKGYCKQTQIPVLIEAVFKERNIDSHTIRKIDLPLSIVETTQGKGGAGYYDFMDESRPGYLNWLLSHMCTGKQGEWMTSKVWRQRQMVVARL